MANTSVIERSINYASNKMVDELIDLLTLEEQVSILAGADYWLTPVISRILILVQDAGM